MTEYTHSTSTLPAPENLGTDTSWPAPPEVDPTPALSVSGITKIFGRKPQEAVQRLRSGTPRDQLGDLGTAAVIDATFDVLPGEIFVVMGLSGSGKSTLIRMLNGLVEPTTGSVKINGAEVTGASASRLRQIRKETVSMVFQHFALLPHRTVLENVAYGLEIQGVGREKRLAAAADAVQLVGLDGWQDKLPSELSGGMQQRVGLARALAADTDVLLMDEAFSALDPLIRREMQEQIIELQHQLGKTIVFITHDLNEAMFLGDRIAVMRDGRIDQIGTPEDILTDPANDYVARFVQDVDRARVLTASAVMEQPRAVVSMSAGPRAALRVMRDLQTSAAFVVGNGRVLMGTVGDREVMSIVKSGGRELSAALQQEQVTVYPDTVISELIEPSVESALPLAVVDDRGRLLGAIPRVTLLAALGNVHSDSGPIDVIEPPATIPTDIITQTLRETAPSGTTGSGEPGLATAGEVQR